MISMRSGLVDVDLPSDCLSVVSKVLKTSLRLALTCEFKSHDKFALLVRRRLDHAQAAPATPLIVGKLPSDLVCSSLVQLGLASHVGNAGEHARRGGVRGNSLTHKIHNLGR